MHEQVLLVLHLPKCGGQTLNNLIFKNFHDKTCTSVEEDWFYQGVGWFPMQHIAFLKPENSDVDETTIRVLQRPDLRAFVGHFSYGIHRHLRRPWAYCTMLRHPVDRLISLHHHVRHSVGMTIEEFVSEPPFKEVDNDQTRRISGEDPQIGQCTDEMLRNAKEHLESDFVAVGVTERFEETVVLMSRVLGWSGNQLPGPRRNVSRNRMPLSDVSDRLLGKILERNELDLKLYEHAWRLLDRAVSRQDRMFAEDVRGLMSKNSTLPPLSFLD